MKNKEWCKSKNIIIITDNTPIERHITYDPIIHRNIGPQAQNSVGVPIIVIAESPVHITLSGFESSVIKIYDTHICIRVIQTQRQYKKFKLTFYKNDDRNQGFMAI